MIPIKGNTYRCTTTVAEPTLGTEYYTEGKLYVSEVDSCLTDNEGDEFHLWGDDIELARKFSDHFEVVNAMKTYSDLLNVLNKAGVKDLFIPELNPYMGSTNWMMIIHAHEDDYKVIVQPQHLEGIDTPEDDEYIGLIRLISDTGDDIDFNYWEPVLIMVDGIVSHISQSEFSFGGNGLYDPIDLDECSPGLW